MKEIALGRQAPGGLGFFPGGVAQEMSKSLLSPAERRGARDYSQGGCSTWKIPPANLKGIKIVFRSGLKHVSFLQVRLAFLEVVPACGIGTSLFLGLEVVPAWRSGQGLFPGGRGWDFSRGGSSREEGNILL